MLSSMPAPVRVDAAKCPQIVDPQRFDSASSARRRNPRFQDPTCVAFKIALESGLGCAEKTYSCRP
jgi:hypothetical protein